MALSWPYDLPRLAGVCKEHIEYVLADSVQQQPQPAVTIGPALQAAGSVVAAAAGGGRGAGSGRYANRLAGRACSVVVFVFAAARLIR